MRLGIIAQFSILLLGALPIAALGQFPAPAKEELAMTSDPRAPGADAVYLYREEVDDDPHAFRTIYARVKILTEAGKEAATVHIAYPSTFVYNAVGNNSSRMSSGTANSWSAPSLMHTGEDQPWDTDTYVGKVEIGAIEGRTIHPDGKIIPLEGKASDLLKTVKGPHQENETSFTLPDAQVGSILEYRYQVRYDRFLAAPDWQVQVSFPTKRAHFVFKPAERFLPRLGSGAGVSDSQLKDSHDNILTDIRSAPLLPPNKQVIQNAAGEYVLDMSDIPAFPNEPYSPAPLGQAYEVPFFYTYTPDAKDYWQKEMTYWNKRLNDYIAPTKAIQNTLRDAVLPTDSPLDKAQKLYALVQKFDNTDCVSDGWVLAGSEWIPEGRVDTVLTQKKGTSNQLAYLYLALARAAGLEARPERIASRSHRIFSVIDQNNNQLDSVVIALTIDGKEIMVDPGTRMAPFETLQWAHAGAGGVALGRNGKVETILTPLQKNTDNSVLHVGSLNVTPQGAISGTLKVAFLGQKAIDFRQLALRSGGEAVRTKIEGLLSGEVPQGVQIRVDHLAFVDDSSKQLLAIVPVTGKLTVQPNGQIDLPRSFFEVRGANPFPPDESRSLPVDMHYPAQEQEQITYVFPAGFTLDGKPQDATLRWEENAAYQSRTKYEANSVTTARILARGFTLLDAKEYTPLRNFYDKVVAADHEKLALAQTNKAAQ